MWPIPVLLLLAGVLADAADLTPETVLLQRARVVMATNLARLPNYTCLQTIERFQRPAPSKKPKMIDIVRLEVALVDGKELFAWPGSGRFSETQIGDMVKGGAIGNGIFALHAKAVFQTNAPRFTYAGETAYANHRAHKWTYVVAQNLSGWTIRSGHQEAVVGYHGTVLVDARTIDLLRLEVVADEVPAHLRIASASMSVDYNRFDISGEQFLLPSGSEMDMHLDDGTVSSNRTSFSGCRHYAGESRVFFDEPTPEETRAQGPIKVVDLPANLRFELELQNALALHGAAKGDPLTAKLTNPLQLPEGTVVPKGALIHGRLVSLRESMMGRVPAHGVGIQFSEMEAPGMRVRFSGTLEEVRTALPGFRQPAGGLRLSPEQEKEMGSIVFVTGTVPRLPRGLRLMWKTKPFEGEDNQ